jgi:hypothetical protein
MPSAGINEVVTRIQHPLMAGTPHSCLRIAQSKTCTRLYHRDDAGAENALYLGWHFVVHGRHPWLGAL